jgi:heme-degrading monooxygenase HmoA
MSSNPYYAVIFSSTRTDEADELYHETALRMFELAPQQGGYLGVDSVRKGRKGITVTYWDSLENIKNWKRQSEHLLAQKMGRDVFYEHYRIRIAKVERECQWEKQPQPK